jgi:hypothetical protein
MAVLASRHSGCRQDHIQAPEWPNRLLAGEPAPSNAKTCRSGTAMRVYKAGRLNASGVFFGDSFRTRSRCREWAMG